MSGAIPKQFVEIAGKPVLVHTIEAFFRVDESIEVVLVLPSDHLSRWDPIAVQYALRDRVRIVTGGATRFQSVAAGLATIPHTDGLVAVHDAVRPCISPDIIINAYRSAEQHQSAVVCVRLKDSIRERKDGHTQARDRSKYYLVQTPQVFDLALLRAAYAQSEEEHFTDDASVFEAAGHQVAIVEGSYDNIKITTDIDRVIAEILLSV